MAGQGDGAPGPPVRAWVETEDGSIARGFVLNLSDAHGCVQLLDGAAIDRGSEVAVRLSLDPAAPSLGLVARVTSSRVGDGACECELEWEPSAGQTQLASLLGAETGEDRG